MPIAVTYRRVSTKDQGRKGFSLPEQQAECLKRARELGATEILEFWDDIPGEILGRPGLTAARDAVKRGGVKWFVMLCADRFARNLSLQLLVAEEIRRAGVELVFTQQNYDNSPEGQFFFQIAGAVAQLEKEKIRERTARGRRGKLKTGRLPGNVDTYGYQFNKETDLLDVIPAEAEWVVRIYTWAADEQLGPYAIRDRLNDMRVPAPRGAQWNVATIKNILSNPTYLGKYTAGRRDWTGYSLNRHRPADERVKPVWRDSSEWVIIPVPAIVDEALFARAQDVLTRRRGIKPKTARLLSGLMTCGLCGGKLHYKPHTKRPGTGRMYYYIFCTNRFESYARGRNNPPALCTLKTIPAHRLESHVMTQVEAWVLDPTNLEAARRKYAAAPSDVEPLRLELETVESQLAQVEGEHTRLVELVTKGLARLDKVESTMTTLISTISRLEARRAELQTLVITNAPAARPELEIEGMRATVGASLARLADLPDHIRAELVRRSVREIRVNGSTPDDWDVVPF